MKYCPECKYELELNFRNGEKGGWDTYLICTNKDCEYEILYDRKTKEELEKELEEYHREIEGTEED